MKTVLFLNTGVGKNLGDRAMLLNIVRQVRARKPSYRLLVAAGTPDAMLAEFNLERSAFLIDCWGRWQKIRSTGLVPGWAVRPARTAFEWLDSAILALLVVFSALTGWRPLRGSTEGEFIASIVDADAVWLSGGGYLTDQGMFECRALLLTALLASLLGKPVVMSGQGLGPFKTRMTRTLFRWLARRAEFIGLRDSGRGAELLAELGVATDRFRTVCDDALTLPPSSARAQEAQTIGVHWRVSPHQAETDRVQGVLEATLDELAAEGWAIRLFVMHRIANYETAIYEEWIRARGWANVTIIRSEDPRELRAEIAACSVGIGMAYHFSVFALSAGVPVIGLWHNHYYKDKLEGLFSAFNRVADAVDDRSIVATELVQRVRVLSRSPATDLHDAVARLGKAHEGSIADLLSLISR